jgi:hypothetical protein
MPREGNDRIKKLFTIVIHKGKIRTFKIMEELETLRAKSSKTIKFS